MMERLTRLDSTGTIAGVKRDIGDCVSGREIAERLYMLENMMGEGRLLVLPCKAGENCFIALHTQNEVLEITVSGFAYSIWHDAWTVSAANDATFFMDNAYSTREEAEAALNSTTTGGSAE